MTHRTTIRDIAEVAGVSHMTVSRVINEKGNISPATHKKVLDAIRQLNFRPSRSARNLAIQRTNAIGLIVPDIANPFFGEIATGVQEVAQQSGYNVFLGNTGWSPEEEVNLLYSLASYPVDGIILCSARSSDADLRAFCKYFHPVVLGGRNLDHTNARVVLLDRLAGMKLVFQHLLDQGHTAIGMLAGPATEPTMSTEMATTAFRQASTHFGIPINEAWITHTPTTSNGGYEAALKLLSDYPEITALCAHNDPMAIGAMKACKELGRRVPQDCAVIGYNDVRLADMVNPSLTTVRINAPDLGRVNVRRIVEMIDSPEPTYPMLYYPEPQLIVRESG
jgi:LacI family transcriptional regulator